MIETYFEDPRAVLLRGEALDALRLLPDDSVDALCTDPPANINFMGKSWDFCGDPVGEPFFGNWLAGFTDGEGCFRIHREKQGEYYACHFQIKMRRDDRRILEQVHEYMGVGRVFDIDVSDADREARPGTNPQCMYLVDTRADCERVREVFLAFPLRAKKAREFAFWCRALDAWQVQKRGNRWHGPSDKSSMEALWLEMKALRVYSEIPIEIPIPTTGSGNPFVDKLTAIFVEVLRVLKPGAHGLVWALPRTSHWTATALENAGFEIRDVHMHVFGTGMPKSLTANSADIPKDTGTALKPAAEHWILVRKPLGMTVSKCFAEYGTGVLQIDACRIGTDGGGGNCPGGDACKCGTNLALSPTKRPVRENDPGSIGRWPAHLSFDEEAASVLDEMSGVGQSSGMSAGPRANREGFSGPMSEMHRGAPYRPAGGASRFFYVAKGSRSQKDLGCEHLPARTGGYATDREEGSAGLSNPRAGAGRTGGARNTHPTVKSIALMRWLCRLICPPGGLVLDCFTGSGSTGVAALHEGFQFLGVERDLDDATGESLGYCEITKARLIRALADTAKEA